MSPEQLTALLVALGAVLAGVAAVIAQLAQLRRQVNGRLSELLDEAHITAEHRGELKGRDYERRGQSSSSGSKSSS